MPSSEFDPCWRRLERAKSHRNIIAAAWNDAIDTEGSYYGRVYVDDDGTGHIEVESEIITRLAPKIALELGEMFYQWRAALDNCIYCAAILESGQDPPPNKNALEFPICPNADKFKENAWKLGPLTDTRRGIIEKIQPYNAPKLSNDELPFNFNRALGILNDWARIDRHRKLHIAGSWFSHAGPKLKLPPGCTLTAMTIRSNGFLDHNCEIATFSLDGWVSGMKIEANPNLFIEIALDETPLPCSPMDNFNVRCEAIERAVTVVIREFEFSFGLT